MSILGCSVTVILFWCFRLRQLQLRRTPKMSILGCSVSVILFCRFRLRQLELKGVENPRNVESDNDNQDAWLWRFFYWSNLQLGVLDYRKLDEILKYRLADCEYPVLSTLQLRVLDYRKQDGHSDTAIIRMSILLCLLYDFGSNSKRTVGAARHSPKWAF